MSRIKKIIMGGFIVSALTAGADLEYRIAVNKPLMEYVDANISTIVQAEGASVGMPGLGLPHVRYVIPREFANNDQLELGDYDPENDVLNLYISKLVAPNANFQNLILRWMRKNPPEDAADTLRHETGHHIVNMVSKMFNLGPARFWSPTWENSDKYIFDTGDRNIATKLVHEGMATYFEKFMNGGKPDFKEEDWPKNENGVRSLYDLKDYHFFYGGGHFFVKPIIDKHKKYGILFILRNMPTMADILNFKGYQDEALTNLFQNIYYMTKERDLKREFEKKYEEFSKGGKK